MNRTVLLAALFLGGCFIEPDRPGGSTANGSVTNLVVGGRHACVLDGASQAICWGANDQHEILDDNAADQPMPVVSNNNEVSSLVVGAHHTCGIINGGINCWGDSQPLQQIALPNSESPALLFAGANATCALDTNSELFCWGAIDASTGTVEAKAVKESPGGVAGPWFDVAIADDHACAHLRGDDVYCWGKGGDHQITGTLDKSIDSARKIPMQLTSVSVGTGASCGITADTSALYCWGTDKNGQLGDQTMPSDGMIIDDTHIWTQVAVSHAHVCALTDGQKVGCFGDNDRGALGDGFDGHRKLQFIDLPAPITDIGVGDDHTCALDKNGNVYCWGSNYEGELGNGEIATNRTPITVPGLPDGTITQLIAGDGHTCALIARQLYCWGDNRDGQASTIESAAELTVPKKAISTMFDVVSAGAHHTCGASGALASCWGRNTDNQLGPHVTSGVSAINVADYVTATGWTELAAGARTTCGRSDANNLLCWGALQVASGSDAYPVDAGNPSYPGPIANGNEFAFAATGSGGLQTMGSGADRCEPFGAENAPNDFLPNSSGSNWALAVADGGGGHACLRRDLAGTTTIACIGRNDHGQAGPETSQCMPTALTVPPDGWNTGATGSASQGTPLAVSGDHSCALSANGKVYCWGANLAGELGFLDGDSMVPMMVEPGPYASIASGPFHVCAITADSMHVQCWGENRYGEVGNGFRFHEAPVRVSF